MVRCMVCGRRGGDDPEARRREEEAQLKAKETGAAPVKVVWICPVCSGKAKHEAEKAGKGL